MSSSCAISNRSRREHSASYQGERNVHPGHAQEIGAGLPCCSQYNPFAFSGCKDQWRLCTSMTPLRRSCANLLPKPFEEEIATRTGEESAVACHAPSACSQKANSSRTETLNLPCREKCSVTASPTIAPSVSGFVSRMYGACFSSTKPRGNHHSGR